MLSSLYKKTSSHGRGINNHSRTQFWPNSVLLVIQYAPVKLVALRPSEWNVTMQAFIKCLIDRW
jgi:hypothetical protein